MLLVIGDGCRKRRGTRHPNMSQGDEECFLLIQRDDVAHDSTFIAGIRQVRNGAMCLIYVSDIFGLKMFNEYWRQLDFEWHGRLECGQKLGGLLRIVEHQRLSSFRNGIADLARASSGRSNSRRNSQNVLQRQPSARSKRKRSDDGRS